MKSKSRLAKIQNQKHRKKVQYIECYKIGKNKMDLLKKLIFFSFRMSFILFFFNFTILYWFCHISKWIHFRYTCVPHPEPSSLLPPHTIPLGRPSAPAPSIQYHASNLDWWLVSYMILYMFQCHSPKSSHPLPLPQRCFKREKVGYKTKN